MFVGTYQPKLDDKGRLILPAKFRDQLEEGVVVTRGQERCLAIYSAAEFERRRALLEQASLSDKRVRGYVRMFASGAFEEQLDKQGRITIAPVLRSYADLDKDVTVIGSSSHIEVWDPKAWDAYLAAEEEAYADLNEEIFPGV